MSYVGNETEYFRLRGQIDDVLRAQSTASQINVPWKLVNLLPTNLVIWKEGQFSDKAKYFTDLKPNETKTFSPGELKDKDVLYTYYRYKNEKEGIKLIPFLQPYIVRGMFKDIKFGAVTYSSDDGGHQTVQASNWDLRGVWIHNKLPIPLDVYYKGRLAAQIGGYNGLGYMGGGSSTIYFSNDREGLDFMDEINFKYSLPGKEGKNLFKVVLDDENCVSMFVGVVSGGFSGPNPDNSIYRIGQPSYRSVTNFLPYGNGNSVMTNPNTPFQIVPPFRDLGMYEIPHPIRDIPW